MVNKARLIEKIADLVKDKKVDGITDLRDESDRQGMRNIRSHADRNSGRAVHEQVWKPRRQHGRLFFCFIKVRSEI